MNKSITVGLLGLGTVGSGVIEILRDHKERIEHKTGCDVTIKSVLVSDMAKEREIPAETELTDRYEDITRDPEIDVIVEVMGGIDHTLTILLEAIEHGKHIVTANKDLVAQHGEQLFEACQKYNCDLYYEASVAGGIPIIRSIMDGLSSDRITKMMGIVNGTTNYIMTKMAQDGVDFDSVLKEAQDLGFAEADPTADVDGLDAARKMTILSILGFSMPYSLEDVDVKGIRGISSDDITYAEDLGYRIKLIGIAENDANGVSVSVEPTLLPAEHPLSSVNDEFNAVYVYGDAVGETMFYGPGAGKLPTATAVVSDLIAVLKNIRLGTTGTAYVQPQFPKQVRAQSEKLTKKYIRLHVDDKSGMLKELTNIFAEYSISFDQFTQKATDQEGERELMMVTHKVNEEDFEKALHELETLDSVRKIDSVFRVEGGE
ncbi:homoserine dehydrogenase [Halobacillus litoralis]|uniref:Homoserine dehydrogenase n=1 Tax=Halobacillus litoralis TaxID=45668 RepID=A0A845DRM1_9BACI|nr:MULTISPECIES: homoserine dehydrogenase [Halobacillus]MYL20150.1 homoserine dehydrogenase [Halobacillus litoralis]MYL29245.1 homoserine dehydrogenase [Halobacillus halophilus]MYL36465.1 homoserine dehydrogenase [Halobacillus litoralis]